MSSLLTSLNTCILTIVDDAEELNAEDIAKKLKPFRQLLDDAAVERELEAELQKDYLFASALHGHKMSLVKQDRGPSPPPAPIQHRKIRRTDLTIGKKSFQTLDLYYNQHLHRGLKFNNILFLLMAFQETENKMETFLPILNH